MVTMDALQRGLQVVETVENSREALKQANTSMTEVLIGQKEAGDYLHFALALDEVRKYAAGKRFVPGFPIYEATQSLIKKMEELDSLIAGQRAGLPDRAENPFISLSEKVKMQRDRNLKFKGTVVEKLKTVGKILGRIVVAAALAGVALKAREAKR